LIILEALEENNILSSAQWQKNMGHQ
jgi:hypothetical protein